MQYLAIKWDEETQRDVGIDSDGTVQQKAEQAELFATHAEAQKVAVKHDGKVLSEERFFGDYDEEDDDE